MKIYSYNVNGIRAAMKKGLLEWTEATQPDLLCIQESKAHSDQVEMQAFRDLGYQDYWHSAVKKGYSGVLTLTKERPLNVIQGMDLEKYDNEGRVLRTDFSDFTLLNCYFPSGSSGDLRHAFKMDFLFDFSDWLEQLKKEKKKIIIVGDYNVVHLDIDIHNPQRKDKPSGFRPEERGWMTELFEGDFNDSLRHFHPETKDIYSWWSYRAGSRKKNKGWRIDYIAVSKNLSSALVASGTDPEAMHSDHCPIWAELDFS